MKKQPKYIQNYLNASKEGYLIATNQELIKNFGKRIFKATPIETDTTTIWGCGTIKNKDGVLQVYPITDLDRLQTMSEMFQNKLKEIGLV